MAARGICLAARGTLPHLGRVSCPASCRGGRRPRLGRETGPGFMSCVGGGAGQWGQQSAATALGLAKPGGGGSVCAAKVHFDGCGGGGGCCSLETKRRGCREPTRSGGFNVLHRWEIAADRRWRKAKWSAREVRLRFGGMRLGACAWCGAGVGKGASFLQQFEGRNGGDAAERKRARFCRGAATLTLTLPRRLRAHL